MTSVSWLIDTGVLVRFLAEDDPQYATIRVCVRQIFDVGDKIFFTPQVTRESWSVFTRPVSAGGYGLSPTVAFDLLEIANKAFHFVHDVPEIYTQWIDLVKTHQVSGRQVHDAYHVAAMKAHGITKILTLDKRDFARYPEIEVVFPENVR